MAIVFDMRQFVECAHINSHHAVAGEPEIFVVHWEEGGGDHCAAENVCYQYRKLSGCELEFIYH